LRHRPDPTAAPEYPPFEGSVPSLGQLSQNPVGQRPVFACHEGWGGTPMLPPALAT